MRPFALALTFALALAPVLAGCVTPATQLDAQDALGTAGVGLGADVQAIAHVAGDPLSAVPVADVVVSLLSTGENAAEPTIGITKEGVLFYTGIGFDGACLPLDPPEPAPVGQCQPRTEILRSKDAGLTWEIVTPKVPVVGVDQHPVTGDPMVHVDVETGRVFDIDQINILCYEISSSDDLGDTWSPPADACLSPPADHQTIVTAKPRLLPTVGYPNVVYVCYNQIATASCMRSLDGARTFQPTGPTGAKGVEPEIVTGIVGDDLNGLCSSLVGHLAASPDGVVYLPRGECHKPMVYVTKDDGISWEAIQVSERAALAPAGVGVVAMDPVVEVDAEGNVYYLWQADDGHLWLTYSTDEGATWAPEVDVLAPGLTGGSYPALGVVAPGKLALSYYGTSFPEPYNGSVEDRVNATWDGYMAILEDALTPAPRVVTVRVNPADDPLVRGQCGPDRCPGIYDFMDLDVDASGRPWAGFVDACVDACALPDGTHEDNSRGGGLGLVATIEVRG